MDNPTYQLQTELIIPTLTSPFSSIRTNCQSQTFEARLKTLKDLYASSVGQTPLIRAKNLEKLWNIEALYLKFEGNNPTGTQKDRVAFHHVIDALKSRYETVTLATCGNYGVAMAFAAYLVGLRCVIYVPGSYPIKRHKEMSLWEAEVVRVQGDYETTVEHSSLQAKIHGWYDANPGNQNAELQIGAYQPISQEIYEDLGFVPSAVATPVSNGTVLAGIYQGFTNLKTNLLPIMVAGSSLGQNPIIDSLQQQKATCEDLPPEAIEESEVNTPLINWHSLDGEEALEGLYQSNGIAQGVSDQQMVDLANLIYQQEGISVLPAGAAGLGALLIQHQQRPFAKGCYVAILTARNY